ncbi:SBBP repeat-containing protein [Hymenobacter latericus]|uniref:SBBP repeat-containing protein n=1 Tax=Hymenobacter sp. YIM 151858-1 TaxID=2987688 RepID=UPI00222740F3|nr:SBBP repeat-containing protein [Hymenobacter sp. YIM 151858-1]UYZ58790.1 SBBP repeat-containing protein [Hymenobacter sp. YIM 151858-1]
MKQVRLLLLAFLYLLVALPALAQVEWEWAKTQPFKVNAVATDAVGRVYVTGSFSGSITLGEQQLTAQSTGTDLLVARFSPEGKVDWANSLGAAPFINGASSAASGTDISVNLQTGEAYVVGSYSGNLIGVPGAEPGDPGITRVVVLKLADSGRIQWVVRAGSFSPATLGNAIATDLLGNAYVTGSTNGGFNLSNGSTFGTGSRSLFVLSLNPAGQTRWIVGAQSTLGARGDDLATNAQGNVYLVGRHFGPARFGGFDLPSEFSTFLARLNPATGVPLWVRTGRVGERSSLAADAQGNLYIGGYANGNINFGGANLTLGAEPEGYVIEVSQNGNTSWLRSVGPVAPLLPVEVAAPPAPSGAVRVVVGLTRPSNAATVLALRSNGTIIWQEQASGGQSNIRDVAVAPGLRIYLGGTLAGQVQFGDNALSSNRATDYLAALAPRANPLRFNWGELSVFPNPAAVQLSVEVPPLPAVHIQLLNLNGRVVREVRLPASRQSQTATFDVRELPGGLYSLRLTAGGETYSRLVQIR